MFTTSDSTNPRLPSTRLVLMAAAYGLGVPLPEFLKVMMPTEARLKVLLSNLAGNVVNNLFGSHVLYKIWWAC